MTKRRRMLSWIICLFFVFSGLLLQSATASSSSIPLCGTWKEVARSIYSSIPISAFINDGVLSIHSNTQRSDIIICISKDGKAIYEETIQASDTDCITIDLRNFDPGAYSIELKNQWGDCLWGDFNAQ